MFVLTTRLFRNMTLSGNKKKKSSRGSLTSNSDKASINSEEILEAAKLRYGVTQNNRSGPKLLSVLDQNDA